MINKLKFAFCKYFVTLFFSHLISKGQGTLGSVIAFALFIPFSILGIQAQIISYAVLFVAGNEAIRYYVKKTGHHDPKEVTIDELLGLWIGMISISYALPLFEGGVFNLISFTLMVLNFILFRIFDIAKPFPISFIDKKMTRFNVSIILDDILAGIISGLICIIIISTY